MAEEVESKAEDKPKAEVEDVEVKAKDVKIEAKEAEVKTEAKKVEAKAEDKPKAEAKAKAKPTVEDEEIRHIVRIAGKDVKGALPIARALSGIKGISISMAAAITKQAVKELDVEETTRIGMLSEKQTEIIEGIVLDPSKHGIPDWMLNRRGDPVTGKTIQLTGHDLDFAVKGNIDIQKKTRSYRGVRHSVGLTVRGQRTKTSGRHGQTIGVKIRKNTKGSGK